jgi:hypothetical protein
MKPQQGDVVMFVVPLEFNYLSVPQKDQLYVVEDTYCASSRHWKDAFVKVSGGHKIADEFFRASRFVKIGKL